MIALFLKLSTSEVACSRSEVASRSWKIQPVLEPKL
jgi:hypothetical protein